MANLHDEMANKQMREIENTEKVNDERNRWAWIGYILRKDPESDRAVVLGRTPKRKTGREHS